MKCCSQCLEEKQLSEFYFDKRRQRANAECRKCTIERTDRYRDANLSRIREAARARGKRDPLKRRAKERRYEATHRDQINEKNKLWHRRNRKKCEAAESRWKQQHPEKMRIIRRNNYVNRQGAEGRHTTEDIASIMRAQRGRCAYCRDPMNGIYHVDHITPISKGGTNWRRNIQLTCITCNLTKHSKDPIEYARTHGMLL